jgi:hypothetical protein
MRYQEQEIVLHTEARYGKRLPLDFCGDVCRQLAPMMLGSVRMAIEGTSSHVGAPPLWLRQASDVRLVGISERGQGDTTLHLEAPPLGEAAEELYKQQTLWETKPAPQDTAVNVLARVMRDVRTGDPESPLYDLHLLKHLSHSQRLFRHSLVAMDMPQNSEPAHGFTRVDEQVALKAAELSERTPAPRPVRVSGHLDMIRHSTRSFELLLEERKPVRGVLEDPAAMGALKSLLGCTVVVVGKAVYRPSGSLLRIDAQGVASGQGESKLFEKVPSPVEKRLAPVRYKPGEQVRRGVPGFFGRWPGEETDEQLLAILKELRG